MDLHEFRSSCWEGEPLMSYLGRCHCANFSYLQLCTIKLQRHHFRRTLAMCSGMDVPF